MQKLTKVIGPAPSEDPEKFRTRLKNERARVAKELSSFRERTQPSRGRVKKTKQGISAKRLREQMEALGVSSVKELQELAMRGREKETKE